MKMRDLKIGDIACINDLRAAEHNKRLIVICKNDFAQMIGRNDGWSNIKMNSYEVVCLTEGVLNATK